jgi:hypothetical protein
VATPTGAVVLDQVFHARSNSLNALRLAFATVVIVSHGVPDGVPAASSS